MFTTTMVLAILSILFVAIADDSEDPYIHLIACILILAFFGCFAVGMNKIHNNKQAQGVSICAYSEKITNK